MSKPLYPKFKSSPALQATMYYARKRTRGIRIAALAGTRGALLANESPDTFSATGVATQFTPTTLDPATLANGTLSNGNLTYTHGAFTTHDGARSTTNKTSGKWYFEITLTDNQAGGGNTGLSIGDTTATYTGQGGGLGANGITEYFNTGDLYGGGSGKGNGNGLARTMTTGDVIGVRVDVDNQQIYVQNLTSGGALAGPFALVSEANYEAMIVTNTSGGVYTFNFGASAFTGTIPSGFAAWT